MNPVSEARCCAAIIVIVAQGFCAAGTEFTPSRAIIGGVSGK
jgi:hypothetical protein